jgi:hypothetical protein
MAAAAHQNGPEDILMGTIVDIVCACALCINDEGDSARAHWALYYTAVPRAIRRVPGAFVAGRYTFATNADATTFAAGVHKYVITRRIANVVTVWVHQQGGVDRALYLPGAALQNYHTPPGCVSGNILAMVLDDHHRCKAVDGMPPEGWVRPIDNYPTSGVRWDVTADPTGAILDRECWVQVLLSSWILRLDVRVLNRTYLRLRLCADDITFLRSIGIRRLPVRVCRRASSAATVCELRRPMQTLEEMCVGVIQGHLKRQLACLPVKLARRIME